MNTSDFTAKKTTVISVNPTNAGTEIWARDESGRETSYCVNDHSFRARAGQNLTAIHYGIHPVILRNDTTMTKIQLVTGEELVGSSPTVESRPAIFWVAWIIFIGVLGPYLIGIGQEIVIDVFGQFYWLKWIGDIIAFMLFLVYVAIVFGVPYRCVVRPRILRSKQNRRIKAADAVLVKIFAPL